MAKYKIGDKVVKIDNNVIGTVVQVMPAGRGGRQLYTVTFPSGDCKVLEVDLLPSFDISDPFERCKSGIFGSYSEYAKRNTTFKIKNSNNSTISSLKASKTLFRAYQFKPLLKFLNSPNRRLLVADEVGLGKTIEAGHIMLELKARRELKNVLIICPKSLQEKWKAELYEKFGLTFKIVESSKDLIADLSSKSGAVRAIINYEKIRLKRDNKPKANKAVKKSANGSTSSLIDYLIDNPQPFSLVLCDEAHKLRNKETLTYHGAEIIMDNADAAIFLTATPVMISEENLYNLLHLLDSTRYFNYDIFKNRLSENKPFVEAMTSLAKFEPTIPFHSIKQNLVSAEVYSTFTTNDRQIFQGYARIGDLYANDPIFNEIIELFDGDDTLEARAHLQYLLSTMNVMNTVFSRTRKREVTTDMSQAERHPHIRKVVLYDEERICFDDVIEEYTEDNSYTDDWGDEKLTQGGALGLVQKKRQVASSVWAYLSDESKLDEGIDEYADFKDAKFEELLSIIKEVFVDGHKKIVVFGLFRKTLKYLKLRLDKVGYKSLIIHGQVSNRAEVLQQFKDNESINVLLSSEVGSEGLDMQFCDSMVNYDLPWNPMVVEQRIGRIDRFGQKSPIVNIYNIVVADSIQEEIYMRLLDRIGIFRESIGDIEAILDAEIDIDGTRRTIQDVYNNMEKEFFTRELSKEERERKIAEIEQALKNEREHLKHLQEGLSNTLTNDAYFKDEINRILYKNAYVTTSELCNYVKSIIRQHLTICNLIEISPDIYEFQIPSSRPTILRNFLTQYCENNDEATISVNQFKRKIEDVESFRVTFDQKIAYENPSINYLNIYHPLIQACLNYFVMNDDETKTSFSYALNADELLHEGNRYYMGLYQLTTTRVIQNITKSSAEIIPILYNLQTNQIESNQDIIDRIFRRSQVEGNERNINNCDVIPKLVDDMSYDFAEFISKEKSKRLESEQRQNESDRLRNEQQAIQYYASRINEIESKMEDCLSDLSSLPSGYTDERNKVSKRIQGFKLQLRNLNKERDERMAIINEYKQFSIDEKLISLNIITIL
jgi:superfamily II DNA or RNA helicase